MNALAAFGAGLYLGAGVAFGIAVSLTEHPLTGEYPEREEIAFNVLVLPFVWAFLMFVVGMEALVR